MLLIAEIALTVAAWRCGWRWRALLPVGIGAALAFVTGFAMGLSDASGGPLLSVGVVFDLAAITALVVMFKRPPEPVQSAPVRVLAGPMAEPDTGALLALGHLPPPRPLVAAGRDDRYAA